MPALACALLPQWMTSTGVDPPVVAGGTKVITILIVVLLLMLVGAIPAWPHSRSWGYAPSGTLGLILIILLVLALTGRM